MNRVPANSSGLTALSHLTAVASPRRRSFFRLARRSLVSLGMIGLLASCLQSGPPDYQDPSRTPPLLDLNGASPLVTEIQPVTTGETIPFSVRVRSEDRGVDLIAVLYLEYGLANQSPEASPVILPASTLSDTSRKIAISWTIPPSVSAGCHQITLLVTHTTNFTSGVPNNLSDIGLATWWLNVNDNPPGTNTLAGCPTATGGSVP